VQTVVATWSVFMVASACIEVGEVFIAKNSFDAGDFGFGLLFGVGGLGLAAGSLAGGALVRGRAIGPFYPPAIAMTGVGYLLASVAPNVWVALPAVLFGGVGNGAAALFNVLLIQRGVVDRLRGRAFTVAMGLTYSVLGLAMAVAGPLTSALGGRWVWAIGGMFCLLASAVALALVPRLHEVVREDEPELEHAKAAAL
jgi:MFS family permease